MPEINIPNDSQFFENFDKFSQIIYADCVLVLKVGRDPGGRLVAYNWFKLESADKSGIGPEKLLS